MQAIYWEVLQGKQNRGGDVAKQGWHFRRRPRLLRVCRDPKNVSRLKAKYQVFAFVVDLEL